MCVSRSSRPCACVELRLIGTGIDVDQRIALANVLGFAVVDGRDHSRHLARDRGGVDRSDGADRVQVDADVALSCRYRRDADGAGVSARRRSRIDFVSATAQHHGQRDRQDDDRERGGADPSPCAFHSTVRSKANHLFVYHRITLGRAPSSFSGSMRDMAIGRIVSRDGCAEALAEAGYAVSGERILIVMTAAGITYAMVTQSHIRRAGIFLVLERSQADVARRREVGRVDDPIGEREKCGEGIARQRGQEQVQRHRPAWPRRRARPRLDDRPPEQQTARQKARVFDGMPPPRSGGPARRSPERASR